MHSLLSVNVLLLIADSSASPCDSEPIVLPIEDVRVLPDIKDSYMRGIPARIGTPAQDIVLLPWADLNNTWVYDEQAYCDSSIIWNDRICEIRRGNLFDEDDSETFNKTKDIEATGGALTESSFEGSENGVKKLLSTGLIGTETFELADTGAFDGFPIGIPRLRWDSGYTMLHALGLGSNSTYLNALRKAEKIGSRVWSIFWGRMWVDDPIDGSIVLGGYDSEKVIGKNYTAPLDYSDFKGTSGCWTGMKILVSDIKLNFRDGSDESILPSNTALPCCLVPQRQLLLEAPGPIFDTFEKATRSNYTDESFGLHWSAKIYDTKDYIFDGDITFHLNSGLEIRVPNDQFLTPFVDIDRNGSRVIREDRRELLINALGGQPATLGRYFLTAAYLMVNHDARTFTLWQANPSKKSSLVRVFDEETARQCEDPSGIVQPSATQSAPLQEATETSSPETTTGASGSVRERDSRPSGAVIGGAVAGVVVGVALSGFVAFYLIRRRKRRQSPVPATSTALGSGEEEGRKHVTQSNSYNTAQEVYGSPPNAAEVQGQDHYVHELDGNAYNLSRMR